MSSKNKYKPNAFSCFMWEWKKQEERKGRTFPNGLKDVQTDPLFNEAWKNLSDQEKARYKTLARQSREQPVMVKRTGLGEKLSDIERAQLKEQEFKDKMTEYITSEVRAGKERNAVEKMSFYVIHINYFYFRILENNEAEYYPAEIALAEFSLENGVTRIYHTIVNEPIKLGYKSNAQDYSLKCHAIPVNPPFGKSDYQILFRDIVKFIEPGMKNGQLPPVYTMHTNEDAYSSVKSVLSRLAAADHKTDDYLRLYSFEELFASLCNATIEQAGDIKIEPIVASIELKKDPFAYRPGLECLFHRDYAGNGMFYCSQSLIKRWIFVLCSFCCNRLGITMIPGIHMPKYNPPSSGDTGLSSSLSTLSLNDSRVASSALSMSEVKSMTGVSNDYRTKVSERTAREDLRRRAEAESKPLEIIDHSKRNSSNSSKLQEPLERPLRPPHTKSAVNYFDSTDTESIDLSENSFPCMGRGSGKKKKEEKSTHAEGYAARLKRT